jgi:hypothetical protein
MENQQNAYKPPRVKLAMQQKEKIEIKNEIANNVKINAPVKILFSCIKVCNGTAYRFLVYELANGKRGLIIERQATDFLLSLDCFLPLQVVARAARFFALSTIS